jgi:hypothetical protein
MQSRSHGSGVIARYGFMTEYILVPGPSKIEMPDYRLVGTRPLSSRLGLDRLTARLFR